MVANTLILLSAFSQGSASIGFNLSGGANAFPKNGKFGLGPSLEYLFPLIHDSGVKAYAAYDWFHHNISDPDSSQMSGVRGQSIALLPLRIGYQQFILPGRLYLTADVGYAKFISASSYKFTSGLLSYAFGGGYRYHLEKKSFIQLSAFYNISRQNMIWSYDYMTARIAYGLDFKKTP